MAIVKILSRHSPSYIDLINYILRYIINGGKAEKVKVYTNNLRSNNMKGYINEFIENESFRKYPRADQIHLFHEIISFSDEDKESLTEEIIDNIANEYMRLRGNTGLILGATHRDKDHVHLHFCVSALHFRTGISFGLNKAQLQELKLSFQKYHHLHFPEIAKSFPAHGKGMPYLTHSQWHAKQREKIVNQVQKCFAQAKSQTQFLDLLRGKDLHHYERNGKPTGVMVDETKFRFSRLLDDKQFEDLPVDLSEETKVMDELRLIRERRQERNPLERDVEDRAR